MPKTQLRVLSYPPQEGEKRNPYLELLYEPLLAAGVTVDSYSGRRALRGRYDIWHVHWPERVFGRGWSLRAVRRSVTLLLLLRLQRLCGARIVWTIHNLDHHEIRRRVGVGLFWRLFASQVDGFISMTSSGVPLALARFPALGRKRHVVIRHGDYRGRYSRQDRNAARARLGVESTAPVFLFCGLIRAYKNVPRLLSAFSQVADDRAVLLIAGEVLDERHRAQVIELAERDSRVRLHLGFVSGEDMAAHLAAADLVVLPFREVYNSGSVMLALSLDRPVLVPASPTMQELRELVGGRWVHCYDGQLDATVLERVMETVRTAGNLGTPDLRPFGWGGIGAQTLDFYQAIVAT